MMKEKEDFYKELRSKLQETTLFPTKYMYKFIIPTNSNNEEKLKNMFNHLGAVITTKSSKSNKYKSFTILVSMNSVDSVISKYVEVDTIGGVISL